MGLIQGMHYFGQNAPTKSVGVYVNEAIQNVLRAAGVSPNFKPELQFLPTLSLIKVEFAHMMFHHVIPSVCLCVKQSFSAWNNKGARHILDNAWNALVRCKWRPTLSESTTLKNSNSGTAVQLKSVRVYQTAWELCINAEYFGFACAESTILRRIMQWVGLFFCSKLNCKLVDELTTECHQICIDIEMIESLRIEFVSKSSLRLWRNLMDICFYWIDLPNHYFGLMYESKHKYKSKFYLTKSKTNIYHTQKTRLLKDLTFQAAGYKPHDFNGLGYGIREIWINNTKNNRMTDSIHKLDTYHIDEEKEIINIDCINNDIFNSPFIGCLSEKPIKPQTWRAAYNRCNKIGHRNNWLTNMNDIKYDDLTKNLKRSNILPLLHSYDTIIKSILDINDIDDHTLNNYKQRFMNDLMSGFVTISQYNGICTFYREWNDSNIRNNDCCWFRQPTLNNDGMFSVNQIFKIHGMHHSSLTDKLNCNFSKYNMNNMLIINGNLWYNFQNKSYHLNFENFDINNVPIVKRSNNQICISAEWIVQKLYMAHDHLMPSIKDQVGILKTQTKWVSPDQNHLPQNKIRPMNEIDMDWCGYGWQCLCSKPKMNCTECLRTGAHAGGIIVNKCQESIWPVYRAYSIHQGFLPRLFSMKSINELY